jgi:short subunit dehydrogenase-like uncharacterized protein
MLYGANGFTGQLIARLAVQQGHRPLLAGRRAEALQPLAQELGLDYVAFSLEDVAATFAALRPVHSVVNAAGPFLHTHQPLTSACLGTHTHYLDITGELAVFQRIYELDAEARKAGVALVPGMGFDIVPTDCLAAYTAAQVPNPQRLELAIVPQGGAVSGGTLRTMLEFLKDGSFTREDGSLVPGPLCEHTRSLPLGGRQVQVGTAPLADLAAAWHHLRIPNIATYIALPPRVLEGLRVMAPVLGGLLGIEPLRRFLQDHAHWVAKGPTPQQQETARAICWAHVQGPEGRAHAAVLDCPEPYRATAWGCVLGVQALLAHAPKGALTPAQAFGADFVLGIPTVVLHSLRQAE